MNDEPTLNSPDPKRRVLVLLAHPTLHRSRVNRTMAAAASALAGVEVHDLYEAYPDGDILVAVEQAKLEKADVVVFLFPFYWYSSPPILKLWQDLVLEHGWAYGSSGNALRGKDFLIALSTGGGEEAYRPEGFNRFTIRQLLAPFDQTAYLCGMNFVPPFVIHGTHRLQMAEIEAHAQQFSVLLQHLQRGTLSARNWQGYEKLNAPQLLAQLPAI
jgi:glutathione-regulated potassium-efflux system ancillary protein KefG